MSIFTELGISQGQGRVKEEVLYNLAACYTLVEKKISRVLEPYDLTPVTMNTLLIIKHAGKKEGLSQIDLSRKMIVSAGNTTRLVDRLEKEKLVERAPKPNDRRVKLIRVTEKASEILDQAWPVYKKEVESIMSVISSADLAATRSVLNNFREKLT